MIHTYLRRVKAAAWFREAKFLGRKLLYTNPGVQHQMNEKRNNRRGVTASLAWRERFIVGRRESMARGKDIWESPEEK